MDSPIKQPKKEGEAIWADVQSDLDQALLPIATGDQKDQELVQAAMGKVKNLFNGAWQQATAQLHLLQQQVHTLQLQQTQQQQSQTLPDAPQRSAQAVFASGALPATEAAIAEQKDGIAPAGQAFDSDDEGDEDKASQETRLKLGAEARAVTRGGEKEALKTAKLSHGSRERTPPRVAPDITPQGQG
jgi:hypothetical protein